MSLPRKWIAGRRVSWRSTAATKGASCPIHFADQTQRLAGLDREADVVHRDVANGHLRTVRPRGNLIDRWSISTSGVRRPPTGDRRIG